MPLAWDTLRLIAVTRATKKESFRHWDTTSTRTGADLRVTSYTEDYAEYQADVFAVKLYGEVLGVRLMSRELNYSEALGDITPDVLVDANARTGGFRLVLSSIAARATQLYMPPETWAFLANAASGGVPPPLPLQDDFDAANRWLLQRLLLQSPEQGDGG
jgi:hypothetical protein